MVVVNIDGDVLLYQCGFAAQTRQWEVDDACAVDVKRFENKEDAESYCVRYGLDPDTIEPTTHTERHRLFSPLVPN